MHNEQSAAAVVVRHSAGALTATFTVAVDGKMNVVIDVQRGSAHGAELPEQALLDLLKASGSPLEEGWIVSGAVIAESEDGQDQVTLVTVSSFFEDPDFADPSPSVRRYILPA